MSAKCTYTYDSLYAMALALEEAMINTENSTQEESIIALRHIKTLFSTVQDKDMATKLKKIGLNALANAKKESQNASDESNQQ